MSQVEIVSHANQLNEIVQSDSATIQLESGKVLYFPKLTFNLHDNEKYILTPNIVAENRKNISFNPNNKHIGGCHADEAVKNNLESVMQRFFEFSRQLIQTALPHYHDTIIVGRTSYRPVEIKGRVAKSFRKDDTRLHVDAFPSTPLNNKRIIRVFSNINPNQQTRNWRLGEDFEKVIQHFQAFLKTPIPGARKVKQWLKITKSYQSLYDHYMLQLHNKMKEDIHYQKNVAQQAMQFSAGSSWIVCTDQVSHAVDSGQYVLEQTFYLPVADMLDINKSPQKILARKLKFKS